MGPAALSIRDAAAYLGLSVATVERRIRDGALPSYRDGRRRLIDARQLEAYRQRCLADSQPSVPAVRSLRRHADDADLGEQMAAWRERLAGAGRRKGRTG